MSVFFVHDAGRPQVRALDRKFRVRDIPPTEEVSATRKAHPKTESNPDDFKHHYDAQTKTKHPVDKSSQQAINNYQSTITEQTTYGRVKDIMSSPILAIDQSKNLADAWRIMTKYEIGHLIILDDKQQYCGMLSEKKIVPFLMKQLASETKQTSPADISLKEFCGESLLSTHPNTFLSDLTPALLEYGLDSIAVFDSRKIIGIVTHTDILKVVLETQRFSENA